MAGQPHNSRSVGPLFSPATKSLPKRLSGIHQRNASYVRSLSPENSSSPPPPSTSPPTSFRWPTPQYPIPPSLSTSISTSFNSRRSIDRFNWPIQHNDIMPFNTIQQAEVDAMLRRTRNPSTIACHLARFKHLQAQAYLKHHMDVVRPDRQILRELQYEHDLCKRHGCAPFKLQFHADRVMIQKDILHRNMRMLYNAIDKAVTSEQAFRVYLLAT